MSEAVVHAAGDAAQYAAVIPYWRRLLEEPDTASGFWCDPAVVGRLTDFGRGDRLALVEVREAGRPVGLVPFTIGRFRAPLQIGLWRMAAPPVVMARLADGEFAARAPRGPILAAAVRELAGRERWDLLLADNCALPPPVGRPRVRVRNAQPTYVIEVRGSFAEYWADRSANTRQTVGRRLRRLEREAHGDVRLRRFRAPEEMDELSAALGRVWARSWHGALGRQRPPSAQTLREYAQAGWVRSYGLWLEGEPVATVLGYQYRGTFYDEAPAYDERRRDGSPGLVLTRMILEDLFADDRPHTVDFGFGYNQYKEMFGTRQVERGQWWVARGARGRTVLAAMRCCDAVFKAGKRVAGPLVRRVKTGMRGSGRLTLSRLRLIASLSR